MKKRIIEAAGSNVLVLFVRICITLVMTPVVLKAMGNHDFGIWEIVSAVIGYMGLLDLGMKPAITRYAAKYNGEKNQRRLYELFATSCVFMFVVGFILCAAFFAWALLGADMLSETEGREDRYVYFLIIIACQLLITFPGYVAQCFIFGFQKHMLNNLIIIITLVFGALIIYNKVDQGNALLLVALVSTVSMFIRYTILFIIVAFNRDIAVRFTIGNISTQMFTKLIQYGGKSFVQGVGKVVEGRSSPILIGMLLNPASVPFYAIPASLANYIQTIGWALSGIFFPLFSDLYAQKRADKVRQVYLDYSRYILGMILPLALCVYLFGSDFISLWVGEEYIKNGQLLLGLLVIYFFLPLLDPLGSHLLMANNRHGFLAILFPVVAMVNIVLSILFINIYGIVGAAMGALAPICISVPLLLRYVCRETGVSLYDYIRSCVFPVVLACLILYFVIYGIFSVTNIESYFDLFIQGGAVVLIYGMLFFSMVLTPYERNKIITLMRERYLSI